MQANTWGCVKDILKWFVVLILYFPLSVVETMAVSLCRLIKFVLIAHGFVIFSIDLY